MAEGPELGLVHLQVEPVTRALLLGVTDLGLGTLVRPYVGVLGIFRDERPLGGFAGLCDWRAGGLLSGLLRRGVCTGARDERVLMPGRATLPVERIVTLGLGLAEDFDEAAAAAAGKSMVAVARALGGRTALLALPGTGLERGVIEAAGRGVAQGLARPEILQAPGGEVAEAAVMQCWLVVEPRWAGRLRKLLAGDAAVVGEGDPAQRTETPNPD